ncbi:MAG: peptidoglycan-binding protein [Kastovskya adunca ATA6-11-RM4]|nr:peptidoglycan-binding protein [Kastovskya adunca ATA6-11-RM4]
MGTRAGWLIACSALGLLVSGVQGSPAQAQRFAQATPAAVVNRPILRLGSEGAAVTELQAALKLLGYYTGTVSGVYDERTAIAVSQFQQAASLQADGVTGSNTWNRLFPPTPPAGTPAPVANRPAANFPVPTQTTGDRPPQPTPTTTNPQPTPTQATFPILREGMQGSAVTQLQERLRTLGFLKGAADGVFGAETLLAVKAAQTRFQLEPDGVVGAATWRALLR